MMIEWPDRRRCDVISPPIGSIYTLQNVYHELVMNDVAVVRTSAPVTSGIRQGDAILYTSLPEVVDPSRGMDLRTVVYAIINGVRRSIGYEARCGDCEYNLETPLPSINPLKLPLQSRTSSEMLHSLQRLRNVAMKAPSEESFSYTSEMGLSDIINLMKDIIMSLIDSGLLRLVPKEFEDGEDLANSNDLFLLSEKLKNNFVNTKIDIYITTTLLGNACDALNPHYILSNFGFKDIEEYKNFLIMKSKELLDIIGEFKELYPQSFEELRKNFNKFYHYDDLERILDCERSLRFHKQFEKCPSRIWNFVKHLIPYMEKKVKENGGGHLSELAKSAEKIGREIIELYYEKSNIIITELKKCGERFLDELEDRIKRELGVGKGEKIAFKTLHGEYFRVAARAGALPTRESVFKLNVLPFLLEYPPAKQVFQSLNTSSNINEKKTLRCLGFEELDEKMKLDENTELVDAIADAIGGDRVISRELARSLIEAVKKSGYKYLSCYQRRYLSEVLRNPNKPMLLSAPPGSGKTLIFMIPIIIKTLRKKINNEEGKVLLVYPRKTLAKDQLEKLFEIIYNFNDIISRNPNLRKYTIKIGIRDGDSIDEETLPQSPTPLRGLKFGGYKLCVRCNKSQKSCKYYLSINCSVAGRAIDWIRDEKEDFSGDRDPLLSDEIDVVVTNHSMLYKKIDETILNRIMNVLTQRPLDKVIAVVFDEAHLYFESEILPIIQKIVAYLKHVNPNAWFAVSSATLANKTTIHRKFNSRAIQGVLELREGRSDVVLRRVLGNELSLEEVTYVPYGFVTPCEVSKSGISYPKYCGPLKLRVVGISAPSARRRSENALLETEVETIHFTMAFERVTQKFIKDNAKLISMTFFDSLATLEDTEKMFRERQVLEARDVLDRSLASYYYGPNNTFKPNNDFIENEINRGIHVPIALIYSRGMPRGVFRETAFDEIYGRMSLSDQNVPNLYHLWWKDKRVFDFSAISFHLTKDDYKRLFGGNLTPLDVSQGNCCNNIVDKILTMELSTLILDFVLNSASLVAALRNPNSWKRISNLFRNGVTVQQAHSIIIRNSTNQNPTVVQNTLNLVKRLGIIDFRVSHLVHFGRDLSKNVRSEVEELLKEGRSYLSRSTQTLEVGVDLSNVLSVIQFGTTASSGDFLQRLGRSGRSLESLYVSTGLIVLSKDISMIHEDKAIDYVFNMKIHNVRGLETPEHGASFFTRVLFEKLSYDYQNGVGRRLDADVIDSTVRGKTSHEGAQFLSNYSLVESKQFRDLIKLIEKVCELYGNRGIDCVDNYEKLLRDWFDQVKLTLYVLLYPKNVTKMLSNAFSNLSGDILKMASDIVGKLSDPSSGFGLSAAVRDMLSAMSSLFRYPYIPDSIVESLHFSKVIEYVQREMESKVFKAYNPLERSQLASFTSSVLRASLFYKFLKDIYQIKAMNPDKCKNVLTERQMLEMAVSLLSLGMRNGIGNEIERRIVTEIVSDSVSKVKCKIVENEEFLRESRQLHSKR